MCDHFADASLEVGVLAMKILRAIVVKMKTIQPSCARGNQPYPPRSGSPSPSGKASLKPYDRTSPVEMHLFENHTTKANALRKCNSSAPYTNL